MPTIDRPLINFNQQPYTTVQTRIVKGTRMAPFLYDAAVRAYESRSLLRAIGLLEKTLAADADYKDAAVRLEYYRRELEDVRTNETDFRQKLFLDPNDLESRFDLADTLLVLNKITEARQQWQELANSDSDYWSKRAKKMLGKYGKSPEVVAESQEGRSHWRMLPAGVGI